MEELPFALKRIFEALILIKPDSISESNLYDLARKAEALNKGKDPDSYFTSHSSGIQNYELDVTEFFMLLEDTLDIKLKDMETKNVETIEDLQKLIASKITLDKLYIDEKYITELLKTDKIKLLIVGRDPYPDAAMGIPFCKSDINELNKHNCSGRHLLNGLAVDMNRYKKDSDGKQIFYDLLREKGIGFVNASYFLIGKSKANPYHIKFSNLINYSIYKKSEKIVVTKSGLKLLKTKFSVPPQTLQSPIDKAILSPTDSTWITVCHPDIRNNHNKHIEKVYKKIWMTKGGLLKYLKETGTNFNIS